MRPRTRPAAKSGFPTPSPVFHHLTFAKAIEQDLLSDYQVVVVGVSDQTYRDYAHRGVFVTADGETVTDARTLASQLGLLRAMAKHDLHRLVSYHSRISNARSFAASLPEVNAWMPACGRPKGRLWTEHVSGEMSSGYRRVRINRLRDTGNGERGVLTNARCLTEGVDVPTLDGVAFIDPRRSPVDIVQAVGRAIRKAEDKTVGTIIIPVFVDENADPEQALDSGEFNRVWEVVKALRAHDEVLADELDDLRRELGRRKASVGKPGKIRLDLPVGIGDAFARAFDTKVVETATSKWQFFYGLLERFAAREGHTRVIGDHVEDGYRLGQWVGVQRTFYGKRRLSEERAARLEALPGWDWKPHASAWEKGFSFLERFVARESHARVPYEHVEGSYRLGPWVVAQRNAHRAGRLSHDRATRLAALPGWDWNPIEGAWPDGYSHLKRFVARESHARVPASHVEDGYRLGQWAKDQRTAYRAGRLSDDRAARLAALPGWEWHILDAAWEKGFSFLERFVAHEGHARVLKSHVEDGYRLGQWVLVQRSFHGAGRLSPERIARLEALPGWTWHTFDADWAEGFSYLERFVARESHARVPYRHVDNGYRLGDWTGRLRAAYGAGRLSEERAVRLATLPGWEWNRHDAAWEEGFSVLQSFVVREGHARVAISHVDEEGYQLGKWVSTQRTAHRVGRLSNERTGRLEALPNWSWRPFDADWAEGFSCLEGFVGRKGDARVPRGHVQDGFPLGSWVKEQRTVYREGRLSEERAARLEALPGWDWNPFDAAWEQRFQHLLRYVERHGHARVPQSYSEDDFALGKWVNKNRQQFKRGRLLPDRARRLEGVAGWTWTS